MTDTGNKTALTVQIKKLERRQSFLKGSKLGEFNDAEIVKLKGERQALDKKKDSDKKKNPDNKD